MAIDTIAGRLAALDAFASLPPEIVERIAREAYRIIFRDGQQLAEAGAAADGAIVIVDGQAAVAPDVERGQSGRTLEPGTMIAELAMVTEHTLSSTIVANGDVRAIKIDREAMRGLMAEHHIIAEHFEARLTNRLSRLALELRLIDERLAVAGSAGKAVVAA